MITKKIIVKGKVQGVFFRKFTMEKAAELGVTGTVKNLADLHTVEIIATGADAQLVDFIEWCKKGPAKADVTAIEIIDQPLQEFKHFSIL
ncbi:acylphosphatase [Niabella insulamsoli]|uniref:acylphosphatase n=1 Tax=Niabella insulamsoli TaxID=3144874 RepID=UPI0031FD5B6E